MVDVETQEKVSRFLGAMSDDELADLAETYEEQLHLVEGEQQKRAASPLLTTEQLRVKYPVEHEHDERDVVQPAQPVASATLVAECNPVDALARRLAFGG